MSTIVSYLALGIAVICMLMALALLCKAFYVVMFKL
jgi:hypothetical protein